MDPEPPSSNPHPRAAFPNDRPTEKQPPPPPETPGDCNLGDEEDEDPLLSLSKPAGWAVTAVAAQAELISAAALSLSSPFLSVFFQSRAAPSRFARFAAAVLRRVAFGLLGFTYAAACFLSVMALAFLLGVFVVGLWVEEPVVLRHPLHLDYTQPNPDAVAMIGKAGEKGRVIPAGHTVSVSIRLVMPESGFNRRVGIFQVSAQAISSTGGIIASSSRPCMLRFRSFPVRLMRTFAMAFPLVIGIGTETQQLGFEALRYGEGSLKTEAIRVWIAPRAGTIDLPQIYDAEILLRSRLPRRKEVVYNWKWTFYLWVSMNMYVLLLVLLFCCFRPFGIRRHGGVRDQENNSDEFGDSLRRWRRERIAQIGEGSASNVAGDVTGDVSGESSADDGQLEASESSECVLP